MRRLKAKGSDKVPSQSIVNPEENTSAITLRSGTQFLATQQPSKGKEKLEEDSTQAKDLSLEKVEATTTR